jgi:creatinine deaminase
MDEFLQAAIDEARKGRDEGGIPMESVRYSTLSPCDMCGGAILLHGIPRMVIGENRTFRGPEDYARSRGVELVLAESRECRELMDAFIRENPELWNEDTGV